MNLKITVSFITSAVLSIPAVAYSQELILSSKSYQADVLEKQGINSINAKATGKVKSKNAAEACNRWRAASLTECISRIIKDEKGKNYSIAADCPALKITSHWGERFRLSSSWNDGTIRIQSLDDGRVLDGSEASGWHIVRAQFMLLCPAYLNKN